MQVTTDDNIPYARAELLEILTRGIAPAIATAPWEAAKLAEGVMTALNILAPLPKEAASDEDKICCDACGVELDYTNANHFSGFLNGKRNIHIHLCDKHSSGLPLIGVSKEAA